MVDAGQSSTDASPPSSRWSAPIALGLWLVVYGTLQFGSLGHPLFWQDEGETAMFGRRILESGYPKVHGREGVVYGMGVPLETAVDPETDAYLGSLWGQYYLAAVGVAWSDGAVDDHSRTRRVRLPFVLTGIAGLFLLLLAMRPELAARTGSAMPGMAFFVLLSCLAISLQLHLREARHAGPTVGLVGLAILLDRLRLRESSRTSARIAIACALALVVWLLINVFYPAAAALMVWIGVEAAVAAWRDWRTGTSAGRRFAERIAPIGLAALASIPVFARFDVLELSQIYSERWSFGPDVYLGNLAHVLQFLWRHELLAAALLIEVLIVITRASAGGRVEPAHRAALSLWRLIVVYALIGARNPIFFERYFVVLGPLLALILVLDVEVLLARFGPAPGRHSARGARGLLAATLVLVLGTTLVVRRNELVGRLREIAVPVEGPIDRIVADLRARHADPAALVIATNYEAEPLMFYLGSEVVGRFHSGDPEAIAAERAVLPDVVIPRTGHARRLGEVRRYLLSGGFVRRALAIGDTPYNSIPELYEGRLLDQTHWFVTRRPGPDLPPVSIYERVGD